MPKVWIDLENTPHVPFFVPIIRRLEDHGIPVILTARDFAQTVALLDRHNLNATTVGGEYGKDTLAKVLGLSARSLTLRSLLRAERVDLAIGHGSRGLLLASKLLRVPSLTLYDYEGASVGFFNRLSTHVLTPEVVGRSLLDKRLIRANKLLTYPGIKEDVYAGDLKPDASIYRDLGLDPSKIIVTIRPPSDTAHYRSQESMKLFEAVLDLLIKRTDVDLLISARTNEQRQRMKSLYKDHPSVHVADRAFDGMNLLYHSDLVIGGGGTMNREAAAIGVPVASVFKGAQGAIDAELVRTGKMVDITRADEISPLIRKRERTSIKQRPEALDSICSTIELLLRKR